MNSKSSRQTPSKPIDSDAYNTPSTWREADRCQPKYYEPPAPKVRIEKGETETIVINNSIQTEQLSGQRSVEQSSGTISRLAWLLLGLASLLFLGSMFMLMAYGKSTNNTSVTKETVNNINRTREVIRTEKSEDSDFYYYAPRARW